MQKNLAPSDSLYHKFEIVDSIFNYRLEKKQFRLIEKYEKSRKTLINK
ncbi:MAG: hypothetical protein H7Y04_05790 [Verrucomicrobia bacterium]|nr:hypothetical protein [Cytophagales bacterium]